MIEWVVYDRQRDGVGPLDPLAEGQEEALAEALGVRLGIRECGFFRAVPLAAGDDRLVRRADLAASEVPEVGKWARRALDGGKEEVLFRPRSAAVDAWERVWGQGPTVRMGALEGSLSVTVGEDYPGSELAGAFPEEPTVFLATAPAGGAVGIFRATVRWKTSPEEDGWPAVGDESALIAENRRYGVLGYSRPYPPEEEALQQAVWDALGVPLAFGTAIRELPEEKLWAAYTIEGQTEVESFDGAIPVGTRFSVLVAGESWVGDIARCLAGELGDRARVRVRAASMERGPDATGIEAMREHFGAEGLRTLVVDVEVDR